MAAIVSFTASGHTLVRMCDGSVYDIDQVKLTTYTTPERYDMYLELIPQMPAILQAGAPYVDLEDLTGHLVRHCLDRTGPDGGLDMVTVVAAPIRVTVTVMAIVTCDTASLGILFGRVPGDTFKQKLHAWFDMLCGGDDDNSEQHED